MSLSAMSVTAVLKNLNPEIKENLYDALHEELHHGITKFHNPDYVLFRVRYTDRLRAPHRIRRIYNYLRREDVFSYDMQILTTSWEPGLDEREGGECYRPCHTSQPVLTEDEVLTEHLELNKVVDAIKAKMKKIEENPIHVDGLFKYTSGICIVKILDILSAPTWITTFEQALTEEQHCGGLGAPPYEIEEFKIQVDGVFKIVQFREYDTESG
jgi:hypothetical protein